MCFPADKADLFCVSEASDSHVLVGNEDISNQGTEKISKWVAFASMLLLPLWWVVHALQFINEQCSS